MEFENAADLKIMSFAIFIRITYQGLTENVMKNCLVVFNTLELKYHILCHENKYLSYRRISV